MRSNILSKASKLEETRPIRETLNYYNLQKFSRDYFRVPKKIPITKDFGYVKVSSNVSEDLWNHTQEPIQAPLLAKLIGRNGLAQQALQMFSDILTYTGDIPSNKQLVSLDITDNILQPALENVKIYSLV